MNPIATNKQYATDATFPKTKTPKTDSKQRQRFLVVVVK